MPYIENEGVKVYYEVEGKGPPVVMAHGGSDSLEMWRKFGYTDYLKEHFQLILFDFRGHGKSDRPVRVIEYGPKMAEDIIKILDTLGILTANYYGYSLGATAGFYLAAHHPERFKSFIFGGVSPYPWPDEMLLAVKTVIESYKLKLSDPDAYVKQMENMLCKTFSPEERDQFLSGNTEADMAVMESLLEWLPLNNEQLYAITTPCFVYCGEEDPFINGARECTAYLRRCRFLPIPGFDHISAFIRSEVILPYVNAFLSVVNR